MGFALGPRINAGGRVGKSDLGVRLLTTSDPQEAAEIAQELGRLNEERRAIEAAVLEQAVEASAACGNAPVAIVAGEGRSEERRVGEECGGTFRSRWSPVH